MWVYGDFKLQYNGAQDEKPFIEKPCRLMQECLCEEDVIPKQLIRRLMEPLM